MVAQIQWNGGGRSIDVTKVAIYRGKTTKVLQRSVANDVDENVCFSLVWDNHSLDLQADTYQLREQFIIEWTAFCYDCMKDALQR